MNTEPKCFFASPEAQEQERAYVALLRRSASIAKDPLRKQLILNKAAAAEEAIGRPLYREYCPEPKPIPPQPAFWIINGPDYIP